MERGTTIHSSILAWKIPWPEEPDGLQSTGSQRVGHDWMTNTHILILKFKTILLAANDHNLTHSVEVFGPKVVFQKLCP